MEKRPCIQAWKQENTWYVQAPASPLASMASGYAGQRGAAGRKGAGKVISDNNRKGCVAVTTLEYGAMSRRSLISAGFLFLCMWTSMSDALLASPPPYSCPRAGISAHFSSVLYRAIFLICFWPHCKRSLSLQGETYLRVSSC